MRTHSDRPAARDDRDIRCAICGRRAPAAGCRDHPPLDGNTLVSRDGEREPASSPLMVPGFPGYRVTGVLGRGGFGTVFEAARADGEKPVAIKLARADRPDAKARLDRERTALLEVGPPHVPEVFALGELATGAPYLVMERIRERPLSARLLDARSMPLAYVAGVAPAILRALEAIHARGYVHKDLKPENIFISEEPEATIIDFGLAVSLGRETPRVTLTSDGGMLGTAEYMSPEQCDERASIDARADIYAAGVIFYEMLTGRPPFWGPPALVRQSHRSRRPQRPSALAVVPPAVEEVLLRCLAKDPGDRFATATELREAIEKAFAERASHPFEMIGADASRGPDSDGAPPPSSGSRERRHVSLVSFASDAELMVIQRRLLLLGGQLAHAAGSRCVAVFSQELGDSPARLAVRAAHELLKHKLCERALVDRAAVSIRTRLDGSRMFLSPLFGRDDRVPSAQDPAGVFLSPAAARALGDVDGVPVPGRDWLQVARPGDDADAELTAPGASAAPLFGREELLGELTESAEQAVKTMTPMIAAVTAEPGYGKTHLAAVLAERLRSRAPRGVVIELRARGAGEEGGGQLMGELLRAALGAPDAAPEDGGRAYLTEGLGAARGAELWPAAALGLGWMSPDAPALHGLEAAPGALRAALIAATGEALQRRAFSEPLFVILDDAHLADDTALLALEHAALGATTAAVWVCAFARPAFEQAHASWGERAGARSRVRLPPLDAASAAELCRHLLKPAESVPDRAVDLLLERAGPAPLLLVELIRGVKHAGMVRRHPNGGAYYFAADELDKLPDLPLIEWVAAREIDALSPAQKAHARLLSRLGSEVSLADVEGILRRLDAQSAGDEFPLDAGAAAKQLIAAGLVVESGPGRLRFRHALIGEALARSVPDVLRRRIHLAALQHYRTNDGKPSEPRLAGLARHAAEAGLPSIAESAYLSLAERARARQIYLDAEQLYSRAIEVASRPSAAAYRSRGLMRYRLARYHDALADFSVARGLVEARGDTGALIEILLDEATALDWMDDYKTSAMRVREASALAVGGASRALEARLLLAQGRSLHRESRDEEACRLLERAAELAGALGDEGYETLVIALALLGFALQGLGRLAEAERALDRSIALCEEHRDALHLSASVNARALLRSTRGDKEGTIADFERVLAIGRELGKAMMEIIAHYNLGEYLYLMSDAAAAEPHVLAAIAINGRSGGPVRSVLALMEARLRLFQGDEGAAGDIVRGIRERQAEAAASGGDASLAPSEDVLCSMVELSTQGASDEAWEALLARSAEWSVGQEKIEVLEMAALAALRRGQIEAARGRAARALAAAAQIPNVMGERLGRLTAAINAQERGPAKG